LSIGDGGKLTAVGDHRQAIYGFRGAKVEIIAELWEQFKKSPDSGVVDLQCTTATVCPAALLPVGIGSSSSRNVRGPTCANNIRLS
jgi:hypothetical protein